MGCPVLLVCGRGAHGEERPARDPPPPGMPAGPGEQDHHDRCRCVGAKELLYLQALKIIAGHAPVCEVLTVAAEQRVLSREADLRQPLGLGHDPLGRERAGQPAGAWMTDNVDFLTTGKLLEGNGTDAEMALGAQVTRAKVNDAVVADVDAMMRKARAPRHQVVAVLEPVLLSHAGSSPSTWRGMPGGPAVSRLGPPDLLLQWGERWDLNPRHPGPQPGALPAELRPPLTPGHRRFACTTPPHPAEEEYSGPRGAERPCYCAGGTLPYLAAIWRAVAESGPGCGTKSACR